MPLLFVFTRNLTGLGLNVEWTVTFKTQEGLVPFLGIYCCFSLHYIKSVPAWFLSMLCGTAECCCWFLLYSLGRTKWVGTALKGGFSVSKASLAVSERVYYYLTCILCIFPSVPLWQMQWEISDTPSTCSVRCSESQSITGYRMRRHFNKSFDPASSPQFIQ